MVKQRDIDPLPEYHKSREGVFIVLTASLLLSWLQLFFAARFPALYLTFAANVIGIGYIIRGIYINFSNSISKNKELLDKISYKKRDGITLESFLSYLDFNQMEKLKKGFGSSHQLDEFRQIYDYVHYFSSIENQFMTPELKKDSEEVYQAAEKFTEKFSTYNSPNGFNRLDISKSLREGNVEQQKRYWREVGELDSLAENLYDKYKAFTYKARTILDVDD